MFKKFYPLNASKMMYTKVWKCLCQSSYLKPLSQVRLKQFPIKRVETLETEDEKGIQI
jgi:hypothetical protein